MEKISNVNDLINEKVSKLKESQDFDEILNEKNNKKNNLKEDEKEIELGGGDKDDHNKVNDENDDDNEEEKKFENSKNPKKKRKNSKKKSKKSAKKKKPANPPRSIEVKSQGSSKDDRTSNFSAQVDIADSASRFKKEKEKNKEKNKDYLTDYILDKKNFTFSKLKDKRGLIELFFSMIKNNNTIFFLIFKEENDLFCLVSVVILSLSFYIFLNTFFMFNSSSLHLFIDQDNDLEEKTKGNYFFLNILISCLLYYATSKIKKWTSIKEFINDKKYQYIKLLNKKKLKEGEFHISLHDLITDISKFKNKKDYHAKILFICGIIFLFFNWYYITCFLGIYENSYDCLILNVFFSLMFTLIFTLFVFAISSILRYIGRGSKIETLFRISQLLNPINNFYNELPYNDPNGDDDEKEKEKEN